MPAAKAPVAKTGAPGTKPAAALPAPPAGKAFPAPPSKGGHAPAHGAKQKTPAGGDKPLAAEKKTSTTATAPSTKVGATGAAGRTVAPAGGRGIGARAAATSPKTGAPHARARAGVVAKVGPKAAVPPVAAASPVTPGAGAKSGAKGASPAPAVAAVPAVEHAHAHGAPKSQQSWAAPGTRHPAGLAIDVAMLKKRDGQWISVANHFRGKIGDKTCGDGVRSADTPEARELRSIVCEANDLGVFTYVLTPNYNAAHADHFHMEIRPQVKWFLYH